MYDDRINNGTDPVALIRHKTAAYNRSMMVHLKELAASDCYMAADIYGVPLDEIRAIAAMPAYALRAQTDCSYAFFVPIIKSPHGGYTDLVPYALNRIDQSPIAPRGLPPWRHVYQAVRKAVTLYVLTSREMAHTDIDTTAAATQIGRHCATKLRDAPLESLLAYIEVVPPHFRVALTDMVNMYGRRERNLLSLINRSAK